MSEPIPLVGGPGHGRKCNYHPLGREVHLPYDPAPLLVSAYNDALEIEPYRYRIARYRLQEASDGGWHYVYVEGT